MIAVYFLKFSFRINYENLHSGNNVKFEKKMVIYFNENVYEIVFTKYVKINF